MKMVAQLKSPRRTNKKTFQSGKLQRDKNNQQAQSITMSTTFNVLRYSALGAGVFYGAYHRYSLESSFAKQQAAKQWKHEEKLIAQAKAEYQKLTNPQVVKPATSTPGSINWEDPNLDLGKALESLIATLD
ncbi:Tim11 protein [Candida orthopsilosis Co 90-125]|uniref:ATP synthase F(0) complex subunit e, mitochondrial n=1 Tax=Candida orthopsilosis (strain 90-125) TaxID=1136231 RepID=H8X7T3_CANO9|nr:Tim11 protein [Candida orthopsilosis Co 90-125]CCG23869.1 Tim11 protein [Candida orthopsilosis Co 90-125]